MRGEAGEQPTSRRAIVAAVGAVVLTAGITAFAATGFTAPAHHTTTARSAFDVPAGTGASVPFTEYEAEAASTTGTVIGPDYSQGTVASEASGRQAVTLAQGQYVEFTMSSAANAVDVAYNVAQGASGRLSVYVDGSKVSGHLSLDSKYSYLDTGNIPGSKTHHLFDDARLMLGTTAAAGSKVRLQVDSGDVPATVDVADFENVGAAGGQPANSLSVTDAPYDADPTGSADATSAINRAATDARNQGKTVWLPEGTFRVTGPLQVTGLTMRGAGPWYTVLHGSHVVDGSNSTSATHLSDFAVLGEITGRAGSSQNSFVNGSLGPGSVVDNVWIQHQEVGIWLLGQGNSDITIQNIRVLDNTADGINFNGTVTDSTIRNNFFRNTGDDAIALWSLYSADTNVTIANNTVVQPNLANGIALYGGTSNHLTDNVVADTNALGSGIAVSNQQFLSNGFSPLAGTITLDGNYLLRTGALNPNWNHPMSAIRFDAYDYPIQNVTINVTDTRIVDSPYSAFEMVGGAGTGLPVTGVHIDGATVTNVGTVVLQAETQGSASFSGVVATGVGSAGIYNCPYPASNPDFTVQDGGGNSGWDSTWTDCSTWPTPGGGQSQPPADGNLARGRPATASGHADVYAARNATDGDTNTYWESVNNAFPQWLEVDLGRARSVDRIVLSLPPSAAWQARTQTLAVSGSGDGSSFTTIVESAGYRFDPASGNTVTIAFDATSTRYLRLTFTANTGWPAGQASELEVYAT